MRNLNGDLSGMEALDAVMPRVASDDPACVAWQAHEGFNIARNGWMRARVGFDPREALPYRASVEVKVAGTYGADGRASTDTPSWVEVGSTRRRTAVETANWLRDDQEALQPEDYGDLAMGVSHDRPWYPQDCDHRTWTSVDELSPMERRDLAGCSDDEERLVELVQDGVAPDYLLSSSLAEVRAEVGAQWGIGLNVLVHDPSEVVRERVACLGYGLDTLKDDPAEVIRDVVATNGAYLQELKQDASPLVRRDAAASAAAIEAGWQDAWAGPEAGIAEPWHITSAMMTDGEGWGWVELAPGAEDYIAEHAPGDEDVTLGMDGLDAPEEGQEPPVGGDGR